LAVLLSNILPDDNRGGAAITGRLIDVLRAVDGDIGLIATMPALQPGALRHTTTAFPDVRVLPPAVARGTGRAATVALLARCLAALARRRPSGATQQAIAASDLVVAKGGQVFKQSRSLGGDVNLLATVLPLLLAQRRGVATAAYSITVGPFPRRSVARAIARRALGAADLVVVRDERSADEARTLGVGTALRLAPDSVFATSVEARHRSDDRYGVATILASGTAALGPTAHAIVHALATGSVDRVLVVLQSDGGSVSDRAMSERLVALVDDPRVTLDDADRPPADLIALYGGAEWLIGGRLHSAIFAVVAGTPAFPLYTGRHTKARDVFTGIGLAELAVCVDDEPAASAALRSAVDRCRTDRAALVAQVVAAVDEARRRVGEVEGELQELARRARRSRSDEG
jgi:polysaccharide pyruvyl transferase WcaK-like protein